MPELEYEPTAAARPVVVERDGGVTRIVVKMRGPYAPVPEWLGELDMFSLVVVPVWVVAVLVVRTCLRLPKPPRALFELSGDRMRMTLRESVGARSDADWPRSAIVEMRANRYGRGLWIIVSGHVKGTYLAELPQETIGRLEAELNAALGNAERVAGDVQV